MLHDTLLAVQSEQKRPARVGYMSLVVAIGLEVGGTLCMRLVTKSEWWRIPAYTLYAAAFSLFPWIMEDVPIAIAYATWSAAGSAAVAAISAIAFDDPPLRYTQCAAVAGIVACIGVLHLT